MKNLDDYSTLEEMCAASNVIPPTDPDERLELREALAHYQKPWANHKLHVKWGFFCDSDNCGYCAVHSSAEIDAARKEKELNSW